MEYTPPYGGDADDPYINANIPGGIPGSIVPAAAIEHVQREIVHVIETAGLVPSAADLTQLAQAFALLAASAVAGNNLPIGSCIGWPTETAPAGWLERAGTLLSITTYEALYDVLGTMYGKDAGVTCTFTAATDLVNKAAHGLANGTALELSNSGGAVPAGLAISTKYFVVNAAANTFQLAATAGGAAIDFTTAGTGTTKYHLQFALMDDRGLYDSNWDHGAGMDPDAATRTDRGDGTTGDHVGTYQVDQYKSHTHGSVLVQQSTNGPDGAGVESRPDLGSTAASGGNATRPRNRSKMAIIKAYVV